MVGSECHEKEGVISRNITEKKKVVRKVHRRRWLDVARFVAKVCEEAKGMDPVVIKVKDITPMADYVVVVSGRSDTHVKALTERVVEGLKKKRGITLLHEEGIKARRWVLLDYGALIVHIFYQPMREFYDLEGLWADAPRVK